MLMISGTKIVQRIIPLYFSLRCICFFCSPMQKHPSGNIHDTNRRPNTTESMPQVHAIINRFINVNALSVSFANKSSRKKYVNKKYIVVLTIQ